MAVQRIWFPNAPSSGINAADRAQIGIGYGGITIAMPSVGLLADWGASDQVIASWEQLNERPADWSIAMSVSADWG